MLASWNEGAAKSTIVDFVTRVTQSGPGPRLSLLLHHDDAGREMAYDREFKVSPLAEALDRAGEYGIHLVSMKRDWKDVFA
jgi:hypothetical protein